jgi:hypothetical protein
VSNTNWLWLQPDEYGGAGGNAATKLMKASTFSAAELLCREVIQNSWDAAQGYRKLNANHQFKIVFRFSNIAKNELENQRRTLGISELRENIENSDLGENEKSTVSTGFVSTKEDATVLYIEDFGAHGLSGHPANNKKSHLYKALYAFGITSKDKGESGGGSYGFGKSAFIRASKTHTVIAYTCFDETIEDRVTRRLVGWSWWEGHESKLGDKKVERSGRAIYGVFSSRDSSGNIHVEPYEDNQADEIAETLGIQKREPGSAQRNGTTLMLLDPNVDPDDLLVAIEKYWWPALVDNLLTISVIDYDGVEHHPKPRQNLKLKPYIRAYELATSPADAKLPPTEFKEELKTPIIGGSLALVGQVAGVAIENDLDELKDDEFKPSVALIRGPRMVIQYLESFQRRRVPIRAAFVTPAENVKVDSLLKDTEPPAHDVWDETSSDDIAKEATALANFVIKGIRSSVAKFANALQPKIDATNKRITLFSKFFGQLLGESGGDPAPIGDRFKVSLKYGKRGLNIGSDDQIFYRAELDVTPSEGCFGKELKKGSLKLHISVNVIEDENKTGERIPLIVKIGGKDVSLDADSNILLDAVESKPIKVELQSESYNHKWTTKLRAEILEVIGGAEIGK